MRALCSPDDRDDDNDEDDSVLRWLFEEGAGSFAIGTLESV